MEKDALVKLKELYFEYYPKLIDSIGSMNGFDRKLSYPLLINPFTSYFTSPRRIMFFGKETRYWTLSERSGFLKDVKDDAIVEQLLINYKKFHFGKNYIRSPFWQFCNKLYQEISLGINDDGYIWNNVIKVDENGNTPKWDIIKASTSFYEIVQKELKILNPEVVIFLTGKPLDNYLAYLFPNIKFVELSPLFSRLSHPELPFHTYRTSHPKRLRLTKVFDKVLNSILCEIQNTKPPLNYNNCFI